MKGRDKERNRKREGFLPATEIVQILGTGTQEHHTLNSLFHQCWAKMLRIMDDKDQ